MSLSAFLTAAAALSSAQADKPADAKTAFVMLYGGGRMQCRLATRRSDPSVIEVFFSRDGKGGVLKGDPLVKISEIAGAPITVEPLPAKGDTTVTAVQFRDGRTAFNFRVYKKGLMSSFKHLTVTRDADESSDVTFEVASGFCVGIIPSVSSLTKSVQKVAS